MDNHIIPPRVMAHRLALMLAPAGYHLAEVPDVRLTPRYNGLWGTSGEVCAVTFCLGPREVTVMYPAADLTLPLDQFAERHLTAAAKALAG